MDTAFLGVPLPCADAFVGGKKQNVDDTPVSAQLLGWVMIPSGLRPGLMCDGWRGSGESSAPSKHTARGEDPKVKCQFFLTLANGAPHLLH